MNPEPERYAAGFRSLAAGIILQASKDLREPRERRGAAEFFSVPWFDWLAESCDTDPDAIRERLRLKGCP